MNPKEIFKKYFGTPDEPERNLIKNIVRHLMNLKGKIKSILRHLINMKGIKKNTCHCNVKLLSGVNLEVFCMSVTGDFTVDQGEREVLLFLPVCCGRW